MTIVYNLVYDLIDENEVFPYAFFIQHATVVSKDLHHSVEYVHDEGGGDVVLCCCYEENSELLGVEEVDSLHTLQSHSQTNSNLQSMGVGLLART
jgi:hypothetical protein